MNEESGDELDDKHVRNKWRHFAVESREDIIDDRQRGAADGKSSALRIVWEPYIDELLDIVDEIEDSEVDDCMFSVFRNCWICGFFGEYIYIESMSCVNEH
jgi:hypothetical protein